MDESRILISAKSSASLDWLVLSLKNSFNEANPKYGEQSPAALAVEKIMAESNRLIGIERYLLIAESISYL